MQRPRALAVVRPLGQAVSSNRPEFSRTHSMHGLGLATDHRLGRFAAAMEPAHSQPLPLADAAGTAAAAAFTVQLPPIRTGFGSPIKDSPVKKMGQSGGKGMASSASFSDWVPARPAARPQRMRSAPQSAAKAAGPSAARGAAMLGLMLLVIVLVFAISRAAASTHQHEMQEARLQFRWQADALPLMLDPNATAPAAGDAVQPWPDNASSGGVNSRGQARRLLRAVLPAMP